MRRPAIAVLVVALAIASLAVPALAAPAVSIRARTEVRIGEISKYYGDTYIIRGQLVDRASGAGLGGEQLELTLGNERVTTTTNSDGSFEAQLRSSGGPQDLDVAFAGSDLLDPSTIALDDVDIDKMPLTIQLTTEVQPDGVRVEVTATSAGSHGVQLPIQLFLGPIDAAADELTRITEVVSNGSQNKITITRTLAKGPGRRRLRAMFEGDTVYAKATAETTIELKSSTTITLAVNTTEPAYEDRVVATGTVTDDDGKGVAKVPVALLAEVRNPAGGVERRRLAQAVTAADGSYKLSFSAGTLGVGRRALQAEVEPMESWLRGDDSEPVFVDVEAPQPVPIAYTIAAFVVTALCAAGFFAARTRPWLKLRRPTPEERRAADPAAEPAAGLMPARSSLVSTLRRPGDYGFAGTVRDAIRHRPLGGARLAIRKGEVVADVVSDPDGGFVVENLSQGEWRIEVSLGGHVTERFGLTVPHRGELRGARVDLMPVRERIFSMYKRAALPALPDPALWGVWSPRQVFDHVRKVRPAPALADLTDYVEERYFSLRLPDEAELIEAERRVVAAVRERPAR